MCSDQININNPTSIPLPDRYGVTFIIGKDLHHLGGLLYSHQIVLGLGDVRVIRAQPVLVDLQSSAVVVLHLFVLALVLTQQGQVVQLLSHIWVVLSKHLRRKAKHTNVHILKILCPVALAC